MLTNYSFNIWIIIIVIIINEISGATRCLEMLKDSHYQDFPSWIHSISTADFTNTIEECIDRCDSLSYCVAWAYNTGQSSGHCILFARKGPKVNFTGIHGGACNSAPTISFNQPKFCPNPSWNSTATTFANISTIGPNPYHIFITTDNTIYVPYGSNGRIIVWTEGSTTSTGYIWSNVSNPFSLFVTTSGAIYVDSSSLTNQVDKWILNSTNHVPVMYKCQICESLFVDISNTLYCSIHLAHQVVKKSLNSGSNTFSVIAGTGAPGAAPNMLYRPYGIFVDTNFDLYVADCWNHRIQLFRLGELSATTLAGVGSLNITITLKWPNGIILDADKYLFIVDYGNSRIVGSGPNGFRCLAGCSTLAGAASNQLLHPTTLSFDSYGNMFVTDQGNSRIQKFLLLTNLCSEITTTKQTLTSTMSNVKSSTTVTPNDVTKTLLKTVSYNQPKFSAYATWGPNAIIFATSTTVGTFPNGIFINTNNMVYVADRANGRIQSWLHDNANVTRTMSGNLSIPYSIFVTTDGSIYVDNGNLTGRVDKWSVNTNTSTVAMNVGQKCYSLFVDINENLYCSMRERHQVVSKSLNGLDVLTIVAGLDCSGSTSNALNSPHGIFVKINFDLYVADCGNNRIQLFPSNQLNGITTVGRGSSSPTITLNCPTGIVLDGDNYLFIVDSLNNRIVKSGPNGFRCLIGCYANELGPNTLSNPQSMAFDSYGNIFVTDSNNHRVQKFFLFNNTLVRSYNQPQLCSSATWNSNAVTFANISKTTAPHFDIFVNSNNTVYVADHGNSRIQIWFNDSINSTRTISSDLFNLYSIFVTINGDIYVSNDIRVDKWTLDANISTSVMNVNAACVSLFVDISNTLYCSMQLAHQVVKKSLNSDSNAFSVIAGNGAPGSAPNMLNQPYGIFVDTNFDLYVADCLNHRIQLFRLGELSATTLAGVGSLNITITLDWPTGIILDADKHLFILDCITARIVGSGPNGFRCLFGCFGSGTASNQLNDPGSLSFDSYGNMFVTDRSNSRIQKFILSTNSCNQTTVAQTTTETQKKEITSTESQLLTTSAKSIVNQTCFSPVITLIPGTSNFTSPIQFRRIQDFYISSHIELHCNNSLSMITKWTIQNCSSIHSTEIQFDPTIIETKFSELYIPSRTLAYGIYELKLTVTMTASSSLIASKSAFVKITSSGITANLIQLGTSMITRGNQQELKLDPGSYSLDLDGYTFDANKWKYEYYCRIYGLYNFPNLQGSFLTIDDRRIDPSNPSCLLNRTDNQTSWKFDDGSKSSITILSGSLQPDRTYQFMVYMENLRNSSLQATGYVLVKVEDSRPQLIAIGCVISTMCVPNLEFQLVNPTTQVALFAICNENCTNIRNITWNIYQGLMNVSSNYTKWTLFDRMNLYQNIWFFGTNTSHFTALNQLFLSNNETNLWRFQVVYTFPSETSSSALNFVINQPPYNGSCEINPRNGTTNTLYTITCPNWFDDDQIKDYSLYAWTNNPMKRTMIAFSSISDFQVRLPTGNNQTSSLNLIIQIRDTLDCITEMNLTVNVVLDASDLTKDLLENNSIVQLLASGNQNTVGQIITSISQQFNKINSETIEKAVSSGIPAVSLSISPLGSKNLPEMPIPWNVSAMMEYNKEINSHANLREYLLTFTTNLAITTVNSIKLQASTLAELTQATNQLTRTTLMLAIDRCYRLAVALKSMSTRIPYEDAQIAATQLTQCAANVLGAVNGPLQKRTNVLNSDLTRATNFPDDYDTDLEFEWSNPNLFADGNDFSWAAIEKGRTNYYQEKLANQIITQVTEMISLLTTTLNIHLNVGQNLTMNTSEVFMSLETITMDSLSNKQIQQVGNAQIHLPPNFTSNINKNSTVSIRSMMEPLASFGNSKSAPNTSLSTAISLSILDQNGKEVSIQTTGNHSIEIIIPRDPNFIVPRLIVQNVTSTPHNQSFNIHYVNITSILPISVHFQIHPVDTNVGYLFIYRFDQLPPLNSSINQIDGWTLICPVVNENIYTYFIDNQHTEGHHAVIFGLRELNRTEMMDSCPKSPLHSPPITDERFYFTSDYALRIYTSGCYYLDKNNQWKSDGLRVGPRTNLSDTQCFSTHLTTFAGGLRIIPDAVNWDYVFANADFGKNKTIYLTVICVSIIYIVLIIYARSKDKKDLEKLGVTPLSDNHQSDHYYYQIIVFTGQRKDAGTKSKVHFVLSGIDHETEIRTFDDPHRQIFQRGGIDAFIMAVPKALGLMNYIRIWHDNSGPGASASWFLKYLIIRDLQTMEKCHFISQRWFAVEKGDGKIERLIPVAGELEKEEFSYLLSKQAYHSVSDGHLWFSIFSRPPSNRFTRVQRCTCCFVLFFISMFLNIMYYGLTPEGNMKDSTANVSLAFGPFYLTLQQIIIGVIIEFISLLSSLSLVQFFRRIRPRQHQISPLNQAIIKLNPHVAIKNKNLKLGLKFPWWCLFIAYGLSFLLVGLSILFIIARGIEFGELKSQKWLTSILSGFFSSIFLTQPMKVLCLAIFFACFFRNSNDDKEAKEFIDDNQVDLQNDEEYLHLHKEKFLFVNRSQTRTNRLTEGEIACARQERVKEVQMWSILQEGLTYFCFVLLLCVIVYSNRDSNSFLQVQHLQKYFLNSRQIDCDYRKIATINEYWNWLDQSFVGNIRAQQWYNERSPKNLSGFINDKSNRLIGWATMRQLRIKSHSCPKQQMISTCQTDYSFFNEEKRSFQPGWMINQTTEKYSSPIHQSFQYKSNHVLDTSVYIGDHGSYSGGGYVYEFRGRLSNLRSNLSELHQLGWIDNKTRAVFIQLSLYNPNVQLFTSVTFLIEFLSTGGIYPQSRFEPLNFYAFTSIIQLICTIIYMLFIVYFMVIEMELFIQLKRKYCQQFWSYVELGIIVCSWSSVGVYIWRYQESKRISKLFQQTNGYVYINLQLSAYVNDLLTFFYGFCCFFGIIKFLRLCRFHRRLSLFSETLRYAGKELLSFSLMFSIVFLSFLCLFYLLFLSKLSSCSSLLQTAQMLFEMTLLKFDSSQLTGAALFLGPFCFSLFIIFVVFICMSMFLSIIHDSFRLARRNGTDDQELFSLMLKKFLRWTGLKKPTVLEIQEERDKRMRSQYLDPTDALPLKIDQLFEAIHRIYFNRIDERSRQTKTIN